MNRSLVLFLMLASFSHSRCFKTIEKIGYNDQLILNQNVIRVKCEAKDEEVDLKDGYAKYMLNKGERLTKKKIVEIRPGEVVFKVSDNISFTTPGRVVATYPTYVKIQKPNKEIKKYRIK